MNGFALVWDCLLTTRDATPALLTAEGLGCSLRPKSKYPVLNDQSVRLVPSKTRRVPSGANDLNHFENSGKLFRG